MGFSLMQMKQELGILGAAAQCNYLQHICTRSCTCSIVQVLPWFHHHMLTKSVGFSFFFFFNVSEVIQNP